MRERVYATSERVRQSPPRHAQVTNHDHPAIDAAIEEGCSRVSRGQNFRCRVESFMRKTRMVAADRRARGDVCKRAVVLSGETSAYRRAVFSRRRNGHHRAHRRAKAHAGARTASRDRQQARRRHHDRRRARREGAAGRLYAPHVRVDARDEPGDLPESALQRDHRFRTGHAGAHGLQHPRRSPILTAAHGKGIHRVRESPPRTAQLPVRQDWAPARTSRWSSS